MTGTCRGCSCILMQRSLTAHLRTGSGVCIMTQREPGTLAEGSGASLMHRNLTAHCLRGYVPANTDVCMYVCMYVYIHQERAGQMCRQVHRDGMGARRADSAEYIGLDGGLHTIQVAEYLFHPPLHTDHRLKSFEHTKGIILILSKA